MRAMGKRRKGGGPLWREGGPVPVDMCGCRFLGSRMFLRRGEGAGAARMGGETPRTHTTRLWGWRAWIIWMMFMASLLQQADTGGGEGSSMDSIRATHAFRGLGGGVGGNGGSGMDWVSRRLSQEFASTIKKPVLAPHTTEMPFCESLSLASYAPLPSPPCASHPKPHSSCPSSLAGPHQSCSRLSGKGHGRELRT